MSIFHQQNTLFNKDFLIHSAFILLSLALLIIFPTEGVFQDFTRSVFFLIIIPTLYIKFIMKEKISNFGINLSNHKEGIIWAIAMFLANIIIISLLVNFTDFKENYNLPEYAIADFKLFLVYELVFTNIILLVNEYFFRGFVLSVFRKYFSAWTIVIEIISFLILFAIIENINWQLTPLILVGITNSLTTYKSRSIVYSYVSSLIFFIVFDACMISLL